MDAITIREKLHDYIRIADARKVKAIYTMIESDLANNEWWDDEKLIKKFDKEYADYKSGKEGGYSFSELKKNIDSLRSKGKKIK